MYWACERSCSSNSASSKGTLGLHGRLLQRRTGTVRRRSGSSRAGYRSRLSQARCTLWMEDFAVLSCTWPRKGCSRPPKWHSHVSLCNAMLLPSTEQHTTGSTHPGSFHAGLLFHSGSFEKTILLQTLSASPLPALCSPVMMDRIRVRRVIKQNSAVCTQGTQGAKERLVRELPLLNRTAKRRKGQKKGIPRKNERKESIKKG